MIDFTDKGLYCAIGDFYIDPFRPVKNAVITHAHGDHARFGMENYLSHHDSIPIMKIRLGMNNHYQGVNYDEVTTINGVRISFHPAGHIIGSAQVRLEYKGQIWVASGDYKTVYDGISPAFEPVKCHAFITESTFGLPIYKWAPQQEIFDDINGWWASNADKGKCSVIFGYSLGKAQRILKNVDTSIGPIFLHGAIYNLNEGLRAVGQDIEYYAKVDSSIKKEEYRRALIVAPPSADGTPWLKRFQPFSLGVASGWMALRGTKRRRAADKGFVLSDHADWTGLNEAIKATEAEKVFVTHGYTSQFSRWLSDQGIEAHTVNKLFEHQFTESGEEETFSEETAAEDKVVDELKSEHNDLNAYTS